jgi:hypothetical protein
VTPEERQKLREVATVAARAVASIPPRPVLDAWNLQTSNSFRRVGTARGDGDVLCATKHPIDGHPDLLAAPGVLDYIVAAQPRVVTALLDDLDALEDKLSKAQVISDTIGTVEKRLDEMVRVFAALGTAVSQLADPSDAEAVAKARALFDQLMTSLQEVHR